MRTGYDLKINPQFIRILYRRLILAGYSKEEAGNLIAKLLGLAAAKKGWTTKELMDMLFLKDISERL